MDRYLAAPVRRSATTRLTRAVVIALGLTTIDATIVGTPRGRLAGLAAFRPDAGIAGAVISWSNFADNKAVQEKRCRSEQPTQKGELAGLGSDGRFDQPTQKAHQCALGPSAGLRCSWAPKDSCGQRYAEGAIEAGFGAPRRWSD